MLSLPLVVVSHLHAIPICSSKAITTACCQTCRLPTSWPGREAFKWTLTVDLEESNRTEMFLLPGRREEWQLQTGWLALLVPLGASREVLRNIFNISPWRQVCSAVSFPLCCDRSSDLWRKCSFSCGLSCAPRLFCRPRGPPYMSSSNSTFEESEAWSSPQGRSEKKGSKSQPFLFVPCLLPSVSIHEPIHPTLTHSLKGWNMGIRIRPNPHSTVTRIRNTQSQGLSAGYL